MAFDLNFLLRNDSLYKIILPFALIFAIIFALLQMTGVLGKKKNIDAIVAIVLAFLVINNTNIVGTISRFLPNVALAILVFLMIILVIGVFLGEKATEWSNFFKGLVAVVSIIVVLWIFGESFLGRFGLPRIFGGLSSNTKGIIVFLIILIVIVLLVTREGGEKKKLTERLDDLGDIIFKK